MAFAYAVFAQFLSLEVAALLEKKRITFMETAPKTCCEGLHFTPFSTLSTSGVPFPSHVQKNCTLTVPCSVLELVRLKFVSSFEFF